MYEKEIKQLEETGQVAMIFNEYLYVIYESMVEEGYQVNKYDPFDLEDGVMDGGLCTGSAKDAIEFML